MRISKDIYKTKEGGLVAVSCDQQPPEGAAIWQGYDYRKQQWIYNGKKDIRTLEELRAGL